MRAVRMSLERPDSITASAVSARDEIGRAVADRIRSVKDAVELKIVTDSVLPQVEKFLESPEEKRLRRVRAGVITALVGMGAWIPALAFTSVMHGDELFFLAVIIGFGAIASAFGLGLVVNGLLFSRLRTKTDDQSAKPQLQQQLAEEVYAPPHPRSGETPMLRSPTTSNLASEKGASVTEHTTLNLKQD